MRGEETQIAGLLAEHPGFEGTVFMPGTHCKWVRVASGEIVDFKTCMTGELFSLLERQSILRHSLKSGGFDLDAFNKTITSALEAPGSAITDLFSVRADDLLKGVLPGVSRAKLSAYLIAGEVLAAKRLWQDQNLVLLGDNELVSLYKTALHAAGADAESADGTGLTIAGLIAAKALVEETR